MDINQTPTPVKRSLKKLGENLRDARKRRRLTMQLVADRAAISRVTLTKIEKGDEGVSIGAYTRVLFVLGLIDRINDLADPRFDDIGMQLHIESLPKRVRIPKQK